MRLSFGRRAASLARHAFAQHGIRLTPRAVASGALVVGAPVAFGLRFLCRPPALAEAATAEVTELDSGSASKWNRTISAVLPAVVSIKVNRVRAFDWPGNVRQLENAVFRAVILCEGTFRERRRTA